MAQTVNYWFQMKVDVEVYQRMCNKKNQKCQRNVCHDNCGNLRSAI